MRWIDRGPAPSTVAGYSRQFTQGWVDYFRNSLGGRPTDSYWREFRPEMGSRTNDICWYCERKCDAESEYGGLAPTVDHFRPLSRYPELAYDWGNWVFSCQQCNVTKENRWPKEGYVDPCADDATERPEHYFSYDPKEAAVIVPKKGLSETARIRAERTINHLHLNSHQTNRLFAIVFFLDQLDRMLLGPTPVREKFIEDQLAGEYGGTIRFVLEQMRQNGRI